MDKIEYDKGYRVKQEALQMQIRYLEGMKLMCQAFEATNIMVAILNGARQIIYANKAFLKAVDATELQAVAGQRPGEAMFCKHAYESRLGCGNSEACRLCQALGTFLTALQSDNETTDETVIVRSKNGFEESMSYQIHVVPFHPEKDVFYIVSLIDNTDTVKRRSMERVFFHDVINTAGAIKNYIGLLKEELPEKAKEEMEFLEEAFQDMLGEIQGQKQLLEAENGELVPDYTLIKSYELLSSIKKLFGRYDCGKGKVIEIGESCHCLSIKTDYVLLRRILCNMLKNALEESEKGETVYIGCRTVMVEEREHVEFSIKNSKYIPQEIQYQIFNKTFTTKGNGRGLGTYSMKLLGERYLNGKVGFISDKSEGTTFYIRLPL